VTVHLWSLQTAALSRQREALAKSRRALIGQAQFFAEKRPSTDADAVHPLLRATVLFEPVTLT